LGRTIGLRGSKHEKGGFKTLTEREQINFLTGYLNASIPKNWDNRTEAKTRENAGVDTNAKET